MCAIWEIALENYIQFVHTLPTKKNVHVLFVYSSLMLSAEQSSCLS